MLRDCKQVSFACDPLCCTGGNAMLALLMLSKVRNCNPARTWSPGSLPKCTESKLKACRFVITVQLCHDFWWHSLHCRLYPLISRLVKCGKVGNSLITFVCTPFKRSSPLRNATVRCFRCGTDSKSTLVLLSWWCCELDLGTEVGRAGHGLQTNVVNDANL